MNFTREPIIETIITPKDGYKLAVRNTKGNEQEEYFVDAVEVVSFGHSFFFRSLERPKPFLVPVTDFQVVEVKETRMVLKNVAPEKAIKIGGGREAGRKESVEKIAEEPMEEAGERGPEAESETRPQEGRMKKRDRRRHRRRGPEERPEAKEWAEKKEEEHKPENQAADAAEKGGGAIEETKVSSSIFSTLFPPPPTLISETIGKYKEKDYALPQRDVLPEQVENESEEKDFDEASEEPRKEEKDEEKKKEEEDASGSDTEHLSRVSSISSGFYEAQSFTSTHIYKLNDSFSDHSFLK